MTPAFEDGDLLLIDRWAFRTRPPRNGEVVAARPPALAGKAVIKRVAAISPEGLTLLGDNPADSLDSRRLGPIPSEMLIGGVRHRLWPLK